MIIVAILQILASIVSIPIFGVLFAAKCVKENVRSILTVRVIERDSLEDDEIKETYSQYTKMEMWILTYSYLMRKFSIQLADCFGEFFKSIATNKVD